MKALATGAAGFLVDKIHRLSLASLADFRQLGKSAGTKC
jgi:hypothetical protein